MKTIDNRYYIIRSDRAGVFAGNIVSREGSEVTLTNCRRLRRRLRLRLRRWLESNNMKNRVSCINVCRCC